MRLKLIFTKTFAILYLFILIIHTTTAQGGYQLSGIPFITESKLKSRIKGVGKIVNEVMKKHKKDGLVIGSHRPIEFHFITNKIEKAQKLAQNLQQKRYIIHGVLPYKTDKCEAIVVGWYPNIALQKDSLESFLKLLLEEGYKEDCEWSTCNTLNDSIQYWSGKDRSDYLNARANDYYERGNLAMAEVYWGLTILDDSTYVMAYYNRGICRHDLEKYAGSMEDYKKAIQLEPSKLEAYINIGTVLFDIEDYKSSIDYYDIVIQKEPNNLMAYRNRGNSKFKLDDKVGACSDWKKAADLGDDYAVNIFELKCGEGKDK